MEMPGPSGPTPMQMEMRMTGAGNMQLNVAKGFVKAGVNDTRMDATMVLMGMTMRR